MAINGFRSFYSGGNQEASAPTVNCQPEQKTKKGFEVDVAMSVGIA